MRKNIYIDYTNGIFGNKILKYHGGGSFTRWLTTEILNFSNVNKINILCKSEYVPITEEEKLILSNGKVNVIYVDSLLSSRFVDNSVLIIPLIPNYKLFHLYKLKRIYPNLFINVVIHGLRNIDLVKYDKYDKYYQNGILYFFPYILKLVKLFKYGVEYFSIKYFLRYADKVFTVSNNSLQEIVKISNVKNINYFHQQSQIVKSQNIRNDLNTYALFVNASRSEKNFIRTLHAFCNYKKTNSNDLKLYVTGVNENFKNRLLRIKIIDRLNIEDWVVFFDYVSSDKLSELYSNSKFLIYTSKSEGYGIPLIESCLNGRPVLASYRTSIPEVLGSIAFYVNPYSVKSIEYGISHINDSTNLREHEAVIPSYQTLIRLRMEIDKNTLINEIVV